VETVCQRQALSQTRQAAKPPANGRRLLVEHHNVM
jgi:hypothetical protein